MKNITILNSKNIGGTISIPPSKSDTIRAIFLALLANGESTIHNPLLSKDTFAAIDVSVTFGATIKLDEKNNCLLIKGTNGKLTKTKENIVINTKNSGTTLNFSLTIAAIDNNEITIYGDEITNNRPIYPIIDGLNMLGVKTKYLGRDGYPPVIICGKVNKNREVEIIAKSSQFVSSFLIAAPFFDYDTRYVIIEPVETPYIEMTVNWLNYVGIKIKRDMYNYFEIEGRQKITPFSATIIGDYSSATFFIVLAAISKSTIKIKGLNKNDFHPDKKVLNIVESFGADITYREIYEEISKNNESYITIKGGELYGREIDMNDTPDAVPAIALLGCFANGETKLTNIANVRIKETDRIKVIVKELKKLGADIREENDSIIIKKSFLIGNKVKSHGDHRIAMTLIVAGLVAKGKTIVEDIECIDVTFPNFLELIKKVNGKIF